MENEDGVMVRTDVAADGAYVVTVEAGADHSKTLDPPRAYRHAGAVMAAAARAEYDAAVLAQMRSKLDIPSEDAVKIVAEMREDRPQPDTDATAPIALEPCVSVFTGKGFLTIRIDGRSVGQWDPADARTHARVVLEAIEVADLDGAYHRYLTGNIGIEADRARAVVDDLANWRE